MTSCNAFREALAEALGGRITTPGAGAFAWHEHLLGCASCRGLLEAEEALELVLAGLPAPELPRGLAERVLARLARERELDDLLALDHVPTPENLSQRTLFALAAVRRGGAEREGAEDERLERLLERPPPPEIPAGLAERVLAAVAGERRRVAPQPAPATRSRLAAPLRLGLAAALVLGIGVVAWRALSPARSVDVEEAPFLAAEEPDPDLLRSLDVLERWDLLADADVALLLAALEPLDQELLDLAFAEDG